MILRDLLLPIPTDPSLKVDVSTTRQNVSLLFFNTVLFNRTTQSCTKAEAPLLFVSEQMGRLQCPLLLVVGEDDQNWPAYESAMDVSLLKQTVIRNSYLHNLQIIRGELRKLSNFRIMEGLACVLCGPRDMRTTGSSSSSL